MQFAFPSRRVRQFFLAVALVLPAGVLCAQAPGAPRTISSIGVGATSLSTTGSSSVGVSGYYITAVNHFAMDAQLSMFSSNGVNTYGSMVVGGYAFGPYLNPNYPDPKFNSAMFFVGGGIWSSFSDAGSSTDPIVLFGGNAPIGPVMVKLGYGFVLAEGSNVSVMNLGLGFKFGQR